MQEGRRIRKNSTSVSILINLFDSTNTTVPKTGLAAASISAASFVRTDIGRTAITVADLATATSAYASGGMKEVDATNCPGLYRFDVPAAALVAGPGVRSVILGFKGATINTEYIRVDLEDDPNDWVGTTSGDTVRTNS